MFVVKRNTAWCASLEWVEEGRVGPSALVCLSVHFHRHGTLVRATPIHHRQSLRGVWCGLQYEDFSWRRWNTEANCNAFPYILCIRAVSQTSWVEIGWAYCQVFNTTNVESTMAMETGIMLQKPHTVLDDHQPPSYKGSSSRFELKADVQEKNPPPTRSSIRFGFDSL